MHVGHLSQVPYPVLLWLKSPMSMCSSPKGRISLIWMDQGPATPFMGYNCSFQLLFFLLPRTRKVQAVCKVQWLLSWTNPIYQWQAQIPKAAHVAFLLALELRLSLLEMSTWEWEAWKCQSCCSGLVAFRAWGSQNCLCLSMTFVRNVYAILEFAGHVVGTSD